MHLMLWLVPLMIAVPEPPAHVYACADTVGANLAQAVAAAADYQPVWERDLRQELAGSPRYADRLAKAIKHAAEDSDLDEALLWSVAYKETRGRHRDSQDRVKRGGDQEVGLMQIMPFWQKALKRTYGVDVDLFDLEDNVLAATYILKRGGDDTREMLSFYNTGQRLRSTPYQQSVMQYMKKLRGTG
jgi:soluble lytic murein transglycosylase-like protein